MLTEEYLVEVSRLPRFQARFWAKVRKSAGCWLWCGAANAPGYGRVFAAGSRQYAHRMAWRAAHGPIPPGLEVLHRCDQPACVNAAHLFAGTQADNMRDCASKGRLGTKAIRGEANGNARLSARQVRQVRATLARGGTLRGLADSFGVAHTTIARIKHRRSWRHLDGQRK